jgi:CheY-like chemotaxis protein
VLFNLLSNAIKFTPEEGTVTVGSTVSHSEKRVYVFVKDTGIGIPAEDQKRVFSEFEQVDNSYSREYEGTGLGLPLVKRFLELHNSEIRLESEPGKGSIFTFYLEISNQEKSVQMEMMQQKKDEVSRKENISDSAAVPVSFGSERVSTDPHPLTAPGVAPHILVVEDDPHAMELMTIFLTREGYQVHHAYNGKEGLDKAVELHPAVIILDIMLPNMDGWEVIQALKKNDVTKDIPIVMVSMTDNRELAFALGALDFLRKPVDKAVLRDLLTKVIEQYYKNRDTLRVLVVDDLEENLLLVTDMIHPLKKDYNLITLTARGGMEALALVTENIPDIIILDLMMPEVDGFEVIRRLKEKPETAAVPVIVLTAMNLTDNEKRLLEEKIQKVVIKSEINVKKFLEEIERLINFRNNVQLHE